MHLFIQQMEVINLQHEKREGEKSKTCIYATEFYYVKIIVTVYLTALISNFIFPVVKKQKKCN